MSVCYVRKIKLMKALSIGAKHIDKIFDDVYGCKMYKHEYVMKILNSKTYGMKKMGSIPKDLCSKMELCLEISDVFGVSVRDAYKILKPYVKKKKKNSDHIPMISLCDRVVRFPKYDAISWLIKKRNNPMD